MALQEQDLGSSLPAKVLLSLRGYGRRARDAAGGTFSQKLERFGFVPVAEVAGHELVLGLAGRFWRPDGGLRPLANAKEFLDFREAGCVKTAWNLRIEELEPDRCALSTETRVEAFGDAARRKFRMYWALIAPFSGAIRVALLRAVRDRAETKEARRPL